MTKMITYLWRAGAVCALLALCPNALAQSFSESFSGTGGESSGNTVLAGFEEPGWTLSVSAGGAGGSAVFDIPNGELDNVGSGATPVVGLARTFSGKTPLETTLVINNFDITDDVGAPATPGLGIAVFALGAEYSLSIVETDNDPNNALIASIVNDGVPVDAADFTIGPLPMLGGTSISLGFRESAAGVVDIMYDQDTTDATPAFILAQFNNTFLQDAVSNASRNVAYNLVPTAPTSIAVSDYDFWDGSIMRVPEPTSVALLGLGALALGVRRRRG